jgi:hypothetical protein
VVVKANNKNLKDGVVDGSKAASGADEQKQKAINKKVTKIKRTTKSEKRKNENDIIVNEGNDAASLDNIRCLSTLL